MPGISNRTNRNHTEPTAETQRKAPNMTRSVVPSRAVRAGLLHIDVVRCFPRLTGSIALARGRKAEVGEEVAFVATTAVIKEHAQNHAFLGGRVADGQDSWLTTFIISL